MHILLTANGYPPAENGGVETYSYNLAHQLIERGHSVHIFCRMTDFSQPDLTILNETVDQIPITRIVNDFKQVSRFEQTYKNTAVEELFTQVLVDEKPDLIHYNHLLGLSIRLPEISTLYGIPSLYMIHDFWLFCTRINLVDWNGRQCAGPKQGADCYTCMTAGETGLRANLLRQLKSAIPFHWRQSLRKNVLQQASRSYLIKMHPQDFSQKLDQSLYSMLQCSRLFAPSDFVRQIFSANGFPAERIEILPLGIDKPGASPSMSPDRQSRRINFGFIGSLLPAKGLDILLKAFANLARPEANLLIFGDDRQATPEFRQLLDETVRSDERVRFLGRFNQAERTGVYQQIDVLVLPSRQPETFSLVAREALAHGKPVISVNAGALPEIITSGVNGLLFPPDDDAALLGYLQHVCDDPTWLDRYSKRASDHVLLMGEHTDRILEIYRQIITTAPPN